MARKVMGIFLFAIISKPALGRIQLPIQRVLAIGGKAARVLCWPLLFSAEVKNLWSYTSTPSMVWRTIKRDPHGMIL